MTCEHKRSTVFNSRKTDALNNAGHRYLGERGYKPFVYRRRRCFDCGFCFTTVEIELSVADELASRDESVLRRKLAKEVTDFLQQQPRERSEHG